MKYSFWLSGTYSDSNEGASVMNEIISILCLRGNRRCQRTLLCSLKGRSEQKPAWPNAAAASVCARCALMHVCGTCMCVHTCACVFMYASIRTSMPCAVQYVLYVYCMCVAVCALLQQQLVGWDRLFPKAEGTQSRGLAEGPLELCFLVPSSSAP